MHAPSSLGYEECHTAKSPQENCTDLRRRSHREHYMYTDARPQTSERVGPS